MHSLTCVSVAVCVVRKPRLCPSYSSRRERINSVLLRSYYKGGGGYMSPPNEPGLAQSLPIVFWCRLFGSSDHLWVYLPHLWRVAVSRMQISIAFLCVAGI